MDLWKKYEDIAMHFNEVIMRWRLQAMGGLAGLLTAAGFVVGDAESLLVRYRAMLILSGVLASAWIGVAVIDLFYYRRLLQGAVAAITDLEKEMPGVALSNKIEDKARRGSEIAPWIFYVAGFLPLVCIFCWAVWQLRHL
jgi:hypothetical protein